MGIEAVLITFM